MRQIEPRDTAKLFIDGVSARDVRQGGVGDCYLAATLASVAHFRPELIREMIRDNGDGTYTVRMYNLLGRVRHVTVDDDLPAYGEWPIYMSSDERDELWSALVEKAYAQARGGYDNIERSFASIAFRNLTGFESDLMLTATHGESRLFETIRRAERERRPMTASTLIGNEARGLTKLHVWSVLGVSEENGARYVILRNPYGYGELRDVPYETDTSFEGRTVPHDGVFRIRIDDFRRWFMALDVMNDVRTRDMPKDVGGA